MTISIHSVSLVQAEEKITWDDFLTPYMKTPMTEADLLSEKPSFRNGFKVFVCPLDDIPRCNANASPRTYQVNIWGPSDQDIFGVNATQFSMKQSHVQEPAQTILVNEGAKAGNMVGKGAHSGMSSGNNLTDATERTTETVDANHHKNGLKNPSTLGRW